MTPRRSPRDPEPVVGELIYGCYHTFGACGSVAKVGEHVTEDGGDYWWVTEHWHDRTLRARREPNGLLYEVELVNAHE